MHRFQNSEQRHACRIQTIMSRESDDIVTISDHNFKMAKNTNSCFDQLLYYSAG